MAALLIDINSHGSTNTPSKRDDEGFPCGHDLLHYESIGGGKLFHLRHAVARELLLHEGFCPFTAHLTAWTPCSHPLLSALAGEQTTSFVARFAATCPSHY